LNEQLSALSQELANAVEKTSNLVVAINARWRFPASGVLWRPGIVVTADHTIKREDDIAVTIPSGHDVTATVVGRDSGTDLAVLRIPESIGGIEPGNATLPSVGTLALAVGRSPEHGVSAAMGIVSTVSGPWRTWRGGMLDNLVKLDVSLYPGLSGAAVVDTGGQIHGLATSGLSRFAALLIPASTINRHVDELLRTGHVARGYIGVGLQPVAIPAALREKVGIESDGGLIVLNVQPHGPAEKAGILLGDILLSLNNKPLADTDEVQTALAEAGIGGQLPVLVLRGGEPAHVTITIEERPRKQD
jgi:S1-C subfamily serine protease